MPSLELSSLIPLLDRIEAEATRSNRAKPDEKSVEYARMLVARMVGGMGAFAKTMELITQDLEAEQALVEEMYQDEGSTVVPPSWELLNTVRDERMRELMGASDE